MKFVALNDDETVWASFGGHVQLRSETWNNFNFGAPPGNNDDTFLLSRLLGHVDLHIGDKTRVFIEAKTAWSTDRDVAGGRRALDVDSLALEQAFVDREFDVAHYRGRRPLPDDRFGIIGQLKIFTLSDAGAASGVGFDHPPDPEWLSLGD